MTTTARRSDEQVSFEDIVSQVKSNDRETRSAAVGRIPTLMLKSLEKRDELLDQVLLMIHNLVCIDSEPYERLNLSNRTIINRNLLRHYSTITPVHEELEALASLVHHADSSEFLVELANTIHNCTQTEQILAPRDSEIVQEALNAIQEKAAANLYTEALLMILSIRSLG